MTTKADVIPTAASRWNLWFPLAAAAALLAAGYYPTRHLCGDAGIRAMLAAVILVAVAVYATLLPSVWRLTTRNPVQRLKRAFRATVVRMALTVVIAALVVWKTWVEPNPFLVWVAIGYVLLIKVETLVLLRRFRQDEQRT